MRRAEESRRSAKVVVEGKQLSRYGRARKSMVDSEAERFSVEEICKADSVERGELVQMDSIPEDVTISISQTALSRIPLLQQFGWTGGQGQESEWYQKNLKSRMEAFGQRLSNWFNTLDYDGDVSNIQWAIAAALDELCSQIAVTILDEVYAQYYETVMRSSPDLAGASLGGDSASRSSTFSQLSTCYEILSVDDEVPTSRESSYSSYEYPSETESVLEVTDAYGKTDAFTASSWVDARASSLKELEAKEPAVSMPVQTDDKRIEEIENLRVGIEQISQYNQENLDDYVLETPKAGRTTPVTHPAVIEYSTAENYDGLAQELSSYEGQSGYLYSTGSRIPAKASAITDESEELAYWMAQTKASDPDPTEKSRPSADCAVIECRRDNSRLDDQMKEWFYSYQPSESHQEGYDKAITIHSRQISFSKSARSRRSLEEQVSDPITAVVSEKWTLTADEQKQDESVGQPAEEKSFADSFHPAYLEDRPNKREETAAERQREENSDNDPKSASGAEEEVPSELQSPALMYDRSSMLLEGTTQAVCDESASSSNDNLLIPTGHHEMESESIDSRAAELKNLALQQTGDLIGVRRLTENRGKAVAQEDEYCLHNDVDQLSRGQPVTADKHMEEPDEDSDSTSGADQELDSDQSSSIVLYNRSSPLLEDYIAPTDLLREDNHHSDYEERQTEKPAAATGHWKRSATPLATEEHPTDNHTQEHAFAQESSSEEERSITTENAEWIERSEDSSGAEKEILSDFSSSEGVVTYDQSSPLLDDYDIIGNIYSDEEDDNLLHQHAQLNSFMPTCAEQPTSSRLLEEKVGMTLLQNQQKVSDQWARPPSPPARAGDYIEDISPQTAQQHDQEMLTQEELDHIAYIQRLAEESSAVVALPPRPPPPSVTAEHKHEEEDEFGLPRYAESIEHEREPSEKSEATSGADEGVPSDVLEEHAFEEKASHWEPHVTPPSPPARTEDYVEDISSQTA
ncbi:unnamed protein product, partial [Heligmosomoides polygyrus]